MCDNEKIEKETPDKSNIGLNTEYLKKVDVFKAEVGIPKRTDAVKRLIDLGLEWYAIQQETLRKNLPIMAKP